MNKENRDNIFDFNKIDDLLELCKKDSEKEKLKDLVQKYHPRDVFFIITTLLELEDSVILHELLTIQDFQKKLGAGFYNFFPETIEKEMELPSLTNFNSILICAEKLLKRRLEIVSQIHKTGFPTEFKPIILKNHNDHSKSNRFNVTVDFSAIKLLLKLLTGETNSVELTEKIVNLNSIKNALIHRKELGFIPEPIMNQERLKKLLIYVIADNPLKRIWCWLNPWNFYNIADYKLNQKNYQNLVDYIEEHLDKITNAITNRLEDFCPDNYHFSDIFALTFEWGIRGWATNEMGGCNLEFFKNDLSSLIRTMTHEIFHRIQQNIFSKETKEELNAPIDSIVIKDFGNPYDNKFYKAISYIYFEGTATFVGGVDNEIAKKENIQKGFDLLNLIYERLYTQKKIDQAEELINSGMFSDGPFYSIGYYISSVIVDEYGSNGSYHNLLEGTISFFKKYSDCYSEGKSKYDICFSSKIAEKIGYLYELID